MLSVIRRKTTMDQEDYQNFTDCMFEEAEDIITTDNNTEIKYHQLNTLLLPKVEKKVVLDLFSVNMIKKECARVRKMKVLYADVSLGFSTLFIGAFISAFLSDVPYKLDFLSIFFYTICPIIGIGLFLLFMYYRKKDSMDIKAFVEKVEECFMKIDEVEGDK